LFTSNKDADALLANWNRSERDNPVPTRALLRDRGYPPEIVARISTVTVFDHLSRRAQAELTARSIERVCSTYGLRLVHIDPHLVSHIASGSPPSEVGARDLEYHVDNLLGDSLARYALTADVTDILMTDGDPVVIQPAEPGPEGAGNE
jgi:ATP-dependent Clp protease ATP-binding subunit ClpA